MAASVKNFDIAIVGAGLAGVGLAHALHHRGIRVQVYEKNAKFDEFGAGLTFSPTAVQALQLSSPNVYQAFKDAAQVYETDVSYVVYNGMTEQDGGSFPVLHSTEAGAVHRTHFLNAMVKHLPRDIPVHFNRNLDNIVKDETTGKQKMIFADGSTALADAIIGADGIGSHVRRVMFGKDHPCVRAGYSGSYMYRAVLPMEKAIAAMGRDKALTPSIYCGEHGEIIIYALENNTLLGLAAMYEDGNPWPDAHHTLRHVKRSDMERDYAAWNSSIRQLISAVDDDLIAWGLFDTADNPVPTYMQGRTLLIGDAAHATCPNMASGAGFAMEDAAILADLLGHAAIKEPADLDDVFTAFNEARVPRGKYLVKGSRTAQQIWGFRAPGVGSDMKKVEAAVKGVLQPAWEADFTKLVEHARGLLLIQHTVGLS